MDQDKLVSLQYQVKQNQQEYGDFLQDLDSWTEEIKVKEEKLKIEKNEPSSDLPPVRNSLEKKKKKKKKVPKVEEKKENGKAKKRIRGYDYRSWDKFDVDKACEDVDEKNSASEEEYETDEEWEIERKTQQAVVFKDQGNQLFKEGKYTEAVECYTRGIDCDPNNSVLPANRAMALLKQEKYGAAELDCTQSLHLDPAYIKAYQRRGAARAALKRYSDAKDDFFEVLRREPHNKQAKAELEKVERLIHPPELLKLENLEAEEAGVVQPIYKPPDQRSKKPLRRIQIEEIGVEETIIKAPKQSEARKKVEAKDNAVFEKHFLKSEAPSKSNHLSDVDDASSNNLRNKIKEITDQVTEMSVDEHHTAETTQSEAKRPERKETKDELKSASACSSTETSPRLPPVPSSSFQFQADVKRLKNKPEQFYQYLKALNPAELPRLLGNALESDMVTLILESLKENYVSRQEAVYPVLLGLAKVKRFDMAAMFMSSQEKTVVRDLLSYSSQHASEEDLAKLAKKYGL